MAEIMINDEMFFSGERDLTALEMNFIKNDHGVYYNSMEGAVYIIDSLADSLTDELAVILFVSRDSVVMAFANNPECIKATTIEFKLNKDNQTKDLNRLRLSLLRYCMIYSSDNSFKVVELTRQSRTIKQLFDKTNLSYEIIDKANVDHALSQILKSFSLFEKIKRIVTAIGIASLSVFLGLYINSKVSDYFVDIDVKVEKNNKATSKHKRNITLVNKKHTDLQEKYTILVNSYQEYQPNPNILQDFLKNFYNGNLTISNFKVVEPIAENFKKGSK